MKARLHAAEPVRGEAYLNDQVLSRLRSLQQSPERVKAYFQNENIQYAA